MNILNIQDLRKSFGSRIVFDGVSFTVDEGERVGFIGPNGSGKSTLLQVVAGIYEPDAGSVAVTGRVRALLELGTGFNPELSGRENVFLNGSLIGLSRADIRARFDQIVSFAELNRPLLAALALAITPVVVATDRNNTIDSLLVVTSLLAAVAFSRAAATGRQDPIAAPDAKPLARAANL